MKPIPLLRIVALFIAVGLPLFLGLARPVYCLEEGHKEAVESTVLEIPKTPVIDFETYQRNVDDIFRIALMTSPNVDAGINGMIVDLNRKIAEDPNNADSLMALGHVYRILGQPTEANRFYQKALKLDPDNFHLNLFAAMTNIRDKNFEGALEELGRAIEKSPLDIYAWMARGRILMILHRYEEAARDFRKALELQPENRQAAFALSLAYQAQGKNPQAFEILQTLKSRDPENPFIRYHLGALALADSRPEEAVFYWEGLFKEGVRDIPFLFNLTVAYLGNGEAEKSKNILNHLSFFFPRENDLDFLMAEAFRQMNLLPEAEREYRLVLAEDPDYLSASIGLGDVLMRQGKLDESRQILSQAKQEVERKQALKGTNRPGAPPAGSLSSGTL